MPARLLACLLGATRRPDAHLPTLSHTSRSPAQENLRREQRAAMEINSCTLCRILAPVQAALYVVEAFPLHCDALGMWCVS